MKFTYYLDYQEYQELGGTLNEVPFTLLEQRSQNDIDRYTKARLKNLDTQIDEVKLCIYELISIYSKYDSIAEKQSGAITSESTSGYSVSYSSPNTDTAKTQKEEIKACIRRYLIDCKLADGTPYMYCGVD